MRQVCLGEIDLKLIKTIKQNHFLYYQLPAIFFMMAIFFQSSLSHFSAPDLGFKLQDKFAHIAEFIVFSFFLRRYFVFNKKIELQKKWYLLTLIIGSLYAISDEIHQSFVPGRTSDIYDVLADIIGVLFVINMYQFLNKKNNAAVSFTGGKKLE